jgi:transcriptional regulator with XRE-family HTH domain
MFTFGDALRAWRKGKGFSLYRLQNEFSISQPTMTAIEKNRRKASPGFKRKLVDVPGLGLSLDQLKAWERLDGASREELEIIREELNALGL